MKQSATLLTTVLTLLSCYFCLAQAPQRGPLSMAAPSATTETDGEIVAFSGRTFENNVYINIKSLNEPQKSFFILERSVNGLRFDVVQVKDVVPNNINIPIIYSLIDEEPPAENTSYRVVQVYPDHTREVGYYIYVSSPGLLQANSQLAD